jgi:ABC-type transport system involved in cytochrome c biogenesis permease component
VAEDDGEMEQLVVLPLALEKLFRAGVSNHMRILMLLLVVDRES